MILERGERARERTLLPAGRPLVAVRRAVEAPVKGALRNVDVRVPLVLGDVALRLENVDCKREKREGEQMSRRGGGKG